ncbi:lactoylglutathione lyase [Biscogniauxia sp. FL1348]|nr:lactoylglutathione lyase [Biscogniauxia sp. FL1348]
MDAQSNEGTAPRGSAGGADAGDNEPTSGYRMNHLMLRIRDPGPSLEFYVGLMGMRTVFTADTGPFTIYYLGYPQTAEHRADAASFSRDVGAHSTLTRTLGLLELCHYHGSERQPATYHATGSDPPHLGFNHIGFTVPDVRAAVRRLSAAGVTVVKDVEAGPVDGIPISQWERERGIAHGELSHHFEKVFRQIAFVKDPDGYLIELVPNDLEE